MCNTKAAPASQFMKVAVVASVSRQANVSWQARHIIKLVGTLLVASRSLVHNHTSGAVLTCVRIRNGDFPYAEVRRHWRKVFPEG